MSLLPALGLRNMKTLLNIMQNTVVNLLQIEYDDRAKATPLTKPVEKPKPKLPEEDGVDDVDIDAI